MRRTSVTSVALGLLASLVAIGCASAPEQRADQRSLEAQADATVASMIARDESLAELIAGAPGYVVFPQVAEAGVIVGGAQSVGVVYEGGNPIGYAELRGASFGLQLGGMTYSQIIVFESTEALDRLRAGNLDLSASLRATALQSGSAATAQFEGGTAVFIEDESGLMAGATVGGEQISFHAK